MSVKELIAELKKYDQELEVIIWSEDFMDNLDIKSLEKDDVNHQELIINV